MRRLEIACFTISLWLGADIALAQPAELPAVPPPPPGYTAPPPTAGPAAEGPAASTPPTDAAPAPETPLPAPAAPSCVPKCRSGYLCVEGQCISACNPPCSAEQTCTPDGQCLATPPLFTAAPEAKQERPRDKNAELHDGFMARATIGFGGASVKSKTINTDMTVRDFSGAVMALSLDVGGAPAENLIIHGRFASMSVLQPRARIANVNQEPKNENSADVVLLAPAVTYYFMPINLYATGAVGFSWLFEGYTDEFGDRNNYRTHVGVGVNFDLGKEWWVNDQWGFGVAGRFWYSHINTDYLDTVAGFALLFSVTYQ
jgi:hypothetical protein